MLTYTKKKNVVVITHPAFTFFTSRPLADADADAFLTLARQTLDHLEVWKLKTEAEVSAWFHANKRVYFKISKALMPYYREDHQSAKNRQPPASHPQTRGSQTKKPITTSAKKNTKPPQSSGLPTPASKPRRR